MNIRPVLSKDLNVEDFHSYYYLKEELVQFCRQEGLPTSGGKLQLSDRIAEYLSTGQRPTAIPSGRAKTSSVEVITTDTPIEPHFVCSERHRAFFRQEIGKGFSFNVGFQQWLKANSGKTYKEAIDAYHHILEEKRKSTTTIDRQFEYNTYIRDFFADNPGRTLEEAIRCWKSKKGRRGHNRYEREDLAMSD